MRATLARMSRTHSVAVANASLAGLLVFVVTAFALQFARDDLTWTNAPLSFYLVGPFGVVLKIAYVGLAASLLLIGLQFFHALERGARSDLAPWLFGTASLGVLATALFDTHLPGVPKTTAGFVHAVSAPIAFLTVTVGMLLQSWHLRYDALWRKRFGLAFALAAACFVGLWLHNFVREWPRGLTQRGVIAMIVAWLFLATAWLRADAQSFASSR